jgi:hypothetical protein
MNTIQFANLFSMMLPFEKAIYKGKKTGVSSTL